MKRKPFERVLQELKRLREEAERNCDNDAGEEDAYRIAIELLEKAMEE